jgi:hypothetical protein
MAKATKPKKVAPITPEIPEEVIQEVNGIVEGSILPSEEDFVLVDNLKDDEPPFIPDEPIEEIVTLDPNEQTLDEFLTELEPVSNTTPSIVEPEEEGKAKKEEKIINEVEVLSRLAKLKEQAEASNTLTTEPAKELSYQAKKWKAYLEYNKIKPEDFIIRYPKHKFLEFVKEFMEFDKNSNKGNI